MASILANGFKSNDKCHRLTVDEALMNHFGAIVMAVKLSGASEVVLIGDVNQLPYLDRDNLFELRYTRPYLVAGITQELLCTHRNPMDVAFALNEIYSGIYSSKTSLSHVHSLSVKGFTGARIPTTAQNTLFLVHTQEEKASLTSQGYGSGEGSRTLTIHEAQGLTYDSVIIINTKSRRLQIHDSVSHAVVAVSRHTVSCVYYTDDADDATGRFIKRAMDAPTKTVVEYNLKTAMQHRDSTVMLPLLALAKSLIASGK
uniref:(+)RNA virus helicase C-terminal domain-containing protein n=1 Tax=Heliothis virescens TaxID=7102 RepID=A0A2A4JSE8_HELVI